MGAIGFNSNGDCVIGSTLLVPNVSYKDTPVTITSWSYVATTITLDVASHTFVAGDYIEVGGLTATTNIPNGVHLVTSVTATTIVFTYALTPTGTAGVSSATVKGYVTTNGRVEGIGVGQTWQDVTASRSMNVTYTNSTGKPIIVSVSLTSISNNVWISVNSGAFTSRSVLGTSCVVPSGATYLVNTDGTKQNWWELR